MATIYRHRSRVTGAAGAPATLLTGELSYNMVDGTWYAGYGDNGSGVATSVKAIAKDNFAGFNLPAGGTNGKILGFTGGLPVWQDAPEGALYTAGNGLTLTGSEFTVNSTIVALKSDLTAKANLASPTFTGTVSGITAAMVGLGSVNNTADSAKPVSTAQQTALNLKANLASPTFTGTVSGITKAMVGLANVDNTADSAKPISTATQTALDGKAAAVHVHAAADVTSGTFADARIPNLDATKITTGVFDIARIPAAVFQATIVSSGNISVLTAPQQANIREGSTVATTDGRFWTYSGSGSKTLEASYIEMADKTPEWTVIANKPAFATVATSGAYADLSGRPTLGTLSSQAASAVAITGGSITGVTIDNVILSGGTF